MSFGGVQTFWVEENSRLFLDGDKGVVEAAGMLGEMLCVGPDVESKAIYCIESISSIEYFFWINICTIDTYNVCFFLFHFCFTTARKSGNIILTYLNVSTLF